MAKLTKAQLAVLSRMAKGDEVWTLSPPSSSTFWHGNLNDRSPSFATLHALWRSGAIESYEKSNGGSKYRITSVGRASLDLATDAEG